LAGTGKGSVKGLREEHLTALGTWRLEERAFRTQWGVNRKPELSETVVLQREEGGASSCPRTKTSKLRGSSPVLSPSAFAPKAGPACFCLRLIADVHLGCLRKAVLGLAGWGWAGRDALCLAASHFRNRIY